MLVIYKRQFSKILQLSFFVLFFWTNQVNGQEFRCGVSSSSPLLNRSYSVKSTSSNPKVIFTIVRDSYGNGGENRAFIEDMLLEVKNFFAQSHINININYCIREVHNTDWLNSETRPLLLCSDDPNTTYYYNIYQSGIDGADGAAVVGSCCGWGSRRFQTAIHELGHMFGLQHTFHNCNDDILAEPVHHDINDPLNCSNKHCTETGDGICDTPADSHGIIDENGNRPCDVAFYSTSTSPCLSENRNGIKDRCDIEYYDPLGIIVSNVMAYSNFPPCSDFTPDQITLMNNEIVYSGRTGTFSECDNSEIIVGNSNRIDGGSHVFYNEVINYEEPLIINNAEVQFVDCTLYFPENTVMIVGKGSNIQFDNTKLLRSDFTYEDCLDYEKGGINFIESHSQCHFLNKSFIETDGVAISTENNATANCSVMASSQVISNDSKAIDIAGLFYSDQGLISGSIDVLCEGSSDFYLNEVTIEATSFPITAIEVHSVGNPISLNNVDINGWENSNSVHLVGGSWVFIYNSELGGNAIISSDNGRLNMVNNILSANNDIPIFALDAIDIKGVGKYEILNNTVSASDLNHLSAIQIESESSAYNKCLNNLITSGSTTGIKAIGSQFNSKFLCNDFQSESNDFDWGIVSILQGYDELIASGNLFSLTNNRISGNSLFGTVYNYKSTVREELLTNQFSNLGISPFTDQDIESAPCGNIGYVDDECPIGIDCSQPCPEGINCDSDCPYAIDCTLPCPEGIDCTQPCPLGINCGEVCPDGIDCTSSCPPGIDCSEPCPPGINCFEPCPPGINCTEPCPLGKDCTVPCLTPDCIPIGDPSEPPVLPDFGEDDNVLELLELQYIELENQINEFEAESSGQDYQMSKQFDDILNSNNLLQKKDIINFVLGDPTLLTSERLELIFKNSDKFSEQEVVDIISKNPIVLYYGKINAVVFKSGSFSEENLKILDEKMKNLSANQQIKTIWDIDNANSRKERISDYAISRLTYQSPNNINEMKKWFKRVDDFSFGLGLLDYIFWHSNYADFNNEYFVLSSSNMENHEITDLQSYKVFMDQIQSTRNDGRGLLELTEGELNVINSIALSNNYYSSLKARNFLTGYYDYNFEEYTYQPEIEKLQFLNEDDLLYTSVDDINENTFPIIYPNPNSGNFSIENTQDLRFELKIYTPEGKLIFKDVIHSNESNLISLDIDVGIYFCVITDVDSNRKHMKKVIIEY